MAESYRVLPDNAEAKSRERRALTRALAADQVAATLASSPMSDTEDDLELESSRGFLRNNSRNSGARNASTAPAADESLDDIMYRYRNRCFNIADVLVILAFVSIIVMEVIPNKNHKPILDDHLQLFFNVMTHLANTLSKLGFQCGMQSAGGPRTQQIQDRVSQDQEADADEEEANPNCCGRTMTKISNYWKKNSSSLPATAGVVVGGLTALGTYGLQQLHLFASPPILKVANVAACAASAVGVAVAARLEGRKCK